MTARCPHCHAMIPKSPGPVLRASALGLGWTSVMGMAFGAAIIGPFVMPALPFMTLASIGIVAAAHEYAHGDRICEACGKVYEIDGERILPEPVEIESEPSALAA